MIVSRRAMIAAGGGAVAAVAVMPHTVKARAATLHIHDSRLQHVTKSRSALSMHDIASEDEVLWRASRSLEVRRGDIVTGETRWSDWVALRGLLAERGLRERSVVLRETPGGTIIVWAMG